MASFPTISLTRELKVTSPKGSPAAVGRDTPLGSQSPWLFCTRMSSDSNINNKSPPGFPVPKISQTSRAMGVQSPEAKTTENDLSVLCSWGAATRGSTPAQEAASHSRGLLVFSQEPRKVAPGRGLAGVGRRCEHRPRKVPLLLRSHLEFPILFSNGFAVTF